MVDAFVDALDLGEMRFDGVVPEATGRRSYHTAALLKAHENPKAMRTRRETVEHPFGTIKARMGATHFLTKTSPRVAGEMALHVLAYNLTRVLNIMGSKPLLAAIRT